jgi:very-short-patch-repair endonuclease
MFFKNSAKKYWFECECLHIILISLNNINNGCWCSYCSNPPKNLCNDEKCKKCFNNSFASHEKSKYWSDKNKLKPREVFKKTDKKILFNCDKCYNEFIISLDNLNAGKWCPKCINKTEQKLYDKLIKLYSTLEQQFRVEWCKNKRYLPFDFIIPEYKIIIELDGLQHFKQVHNWSSPEVQEQNDKYKMKCANNNGFSIIRILQEDVFYDTYNWLKELDDNIIKIKNDKIIQNIFMFKNNEYNNFL